MQSSNSIIVKEKKEKRKYPKIIIESFRLEKDL